MAFINKKAFDLNDPSFLSYIGAGNSTSSGVNITDKIALSDSTFFSCVRVKGQAMGQLPIKLYKVVDGKQVEVKDGMTHDTICVSPNKKQTLQEMIEQSITHLDTAGNFYAHVTKTPRGEIKQILPFDSAKSVTEIENADNTISYSLTFTNGKTKIYKKEEVLHIRNIAYNTYKGISTVSVAAEALGLSVAASKHAATFYKNGSKPGGFLVSSKKLHKDVQDRLVMQFENRHLGAENAHKLAVLEDGIDYKTVQVSLRESQLLETRKNSVEEICRILGVPPQMIGHNSGLSFSNIEEMNRSFYNTTLGSLITKYENALNMLLPRGYIVKFDVSKFTRADNKTTAEVVDKLFKSSMITINEGRERLGLAPVEGGDVYAIDTNNHTLGRIENIEEIQKLQQEQNTTVVNNNNNNNDVEEGDEENA